MWNTTYKRNEQQRVIAMIHDFGNGVNVITDIENNTSKLMHGEIEMGEHDIFPQVGIYTRYLENIDNEVNYQPTKTEEE